MLNCYNCIYLDAENHFCKRRVHNVPGICPYAEERKPRNNFERLKAMSMEEMAEVFVGKCCPTIFADKMAVNTKDCSRHFVRNECEQCWNNWLKEAIE
jgi:hypothetical protein